MRESEETREREKKSDAHAIDLFANAAFEIGLARIRRVEVKTDVALLCTLQAGDN